MRQNVRARFMKPRLLFGVAIPLLAVLAVPFIVQHAFGLTVSDNFNRANGGLGSNWTTVTGTTAPKIVSNTAQVGSANKLNSAYWSANTFGSDQFAQATLPASTGSTFGPGIAVRLSNSKGYILWYGNSSNVVSLWRMDSATSWTELAQSSNLTLHPATDVWKVQVVGSTLTGYQNGTQVVQTTDTHYTTGAPGVWLYYSTNKITNWSGGDVTTTPTYSVGGTVSGLSGTVVLQDNAGDDLNVTANGSFSFATKLASGSLYSATVKTNPANQTCTVSNGSGTIGSANVTNIAISCTTNVVQTYSVGGTVSGLSGTVVLQNNGGDALSVSTNGTFTFATQLNSGAAYGVTIQTAPTGQTCVVSNGSGTIGSANVTNVAVTCTTNTSGSANDNFNRADGPLGSGWTDTSDGGMGIVSQAVAGTTAGQTGDIRTGETYNSDQYSQIQTAVQQLTGGQWVGASVRMQNNGLSNYTGLYFWNNGAPELMVFKRTSGNWSQLGSAYSSGVLPAGTTLELTATGSTISLLENGTVVITTTDSGLTGGNPGIMAYGTAQADNWSGGNMVTGSTYTVGGTVTGLTGTVVLQNNGASTLNVNTNGSFTFASPLPTGAAYSVTVQTNPANQTCTVTNGSGTVSATNITNVAVSCSTNGGSGGSGGLQTQYLGTDSNGVETYSATSADNGHGAQTIRVLRPTNPAAGVAHNFLITLPVHAGSDDTTYGDGLDTARSLNAQNQYNLTIIEPSFGIDPWYADNPNDSAEQEETYMTADLMPWVTQNLATTGTEQTWLIGFSKSGIGGQDLILKHPGLFTLAATWDFPADMSSYDEYGIDNSGASYGTDANFQANYRLTSSFLSAHAAPFTAHNRIWIGSYQIFQQDVADYDSLLTSQGILHATETPTSMTHSWTSGWVPLALMALYQDSTNQ